MFTLLRLTRPAEDTNRPVGRSSRQRLKRLEDRLAPAAINISTGFDN